MSTTIHYELPDVKVPDLIGWSKKHPKKYKKLVRALDRERRGIPVDRVPRTLAGQEKIVYLQQMYAKVFMANSPVKMPEGMATFKGLTNDIKEKRHSITLGFKPIFEITEKKFNIMKAEIEDVVRKFSGSLIPVRQYPSYPSKYQPHQGTQECKRRAAGLVREGVGFEAVTDKGTMVITPSGSFQERLGVSW
jgi:hypothetical protein